MIKYMPSYQSNSTAKHAIQNTLDYSYMPNKHSGLTYEIYTFYSYVKF